MHLALGGGASAKGLLLLTAGGLTLSVLAVHCTHTPHDTGDHLPAVCLSGMERVTFQWIDTFRKGKARVARMWGLMMWPGSWSESDDQAGGATDRHPHEHAQVMNG